MMKKLVLSALLLGATAANATTFNFLEYAATGSNTFTTTTTTLGSQLSVDVLSKDADEVTFTFKNAVGLASSVVGVYFIDAAPSLFNSISFTSSSSGVDFDVDSNAQNFENSPNNQKVFTEVKTAEVDDGSSDGLNSSADSITFTGKVNSSTNANTLFNLVIAAISSGDLKFGLEVDLPNTSTDKKYLNSPSAVPVPAAVWLFGSVIGLFGLARRRFVA